MRGIRKEHVYLTNAERSHIQSEFIVNGRVGPSFSDVVTLNATCIRRAFHGSGAIGRLRRTRQLQYNNETCPKIDSLKAFKSPTWDVYNHGHRLYLVLT